MRQELDKQVSEGLPRTDLRSQFGVLMWIYFALMLPGALLGWLISHFKLNGIAPATALSLLAFLGLAAATYGVRFLTSPSDDTNVVWKPWIVDTCLVVLALLIGFGLLWTS